MPSTPASMHTARKLTRIGTPIRAETELIRMLAATNTPPIKNRRSMLPTYKCALPVEYDLGYPDYKIHAEVMPRILTCRFDALSKNYFPFKGFGPLLETPGSCCGPSEPSLGHL